MEGGWCAFLGGLGGNGEVLGELGSGKLNCLGVRPGKWDGCGEFRMVLLGLMWFVWGFRMGQREFLRESPGAVEGRDGRLCVFFGVC